MNYRSERFIRLAAGLTQADIAEKAGVSVTTIHHFEVNTNNIRPGTEKRIKEIYMDVYNNMRYGELVLALAMELKVANNRKIRKKLKEDIITYLDYVV